MRKMRNIWLTVWVAVCCAVLPAGCHKDDGPSFGERNVSVLMSVGSRAGEETPTGAEAAINTLRVYAFVGGEPAGHYYTAEPVVSPERFLMDLKMFSLTKQTVDFYVVANEGTMVTPGSSEILNDETTEGELKRFSFTSLDQERGLPMFVHRRVELDVATDAAGSGADMSGHEGHTLLNQKVDFELQRSVAKLGVFAAKAAGETGDLSVTGLTLKGSGLRALNYLAPQDRETLEKIPARGSDMGLSVNGNVCKEFPQDGKPEDPANYTDVLQAPFYLFENAYGSASWDVEGSGEGNVLEISYRIGGVDKTGTVYLPPIARNKYYAVCCRMRNSGGITVEYTVADWTRADNWEGGLTFEYPTSSNPLEAQDFGERTDPQVRYSADNQEAGAFVAMFQMSAPAGQQWTPVLDAPETDFEVRVYDNTGRRRLTDPEEWIAAPDWYTIKVVALKPENVGKTVNLGITFTPVYAQEAQYLLINGGSGGNTGWPDSGVKTDRILIEQVESK